jgi:maleate isomerase
MTKTLRIGQIVPSSNTTMETEIPAMLLARQTIRPERFTFHSTLERVVPGAGALLSGAY